MPGLKRKCEELVKEKYGSQILKTVTLASCVEYLGRDMFIENQQGYDVECIRVALRVLWQTGQIPDMSLPENAIEKLVV